MLLDNAMNPDEAGEDRAINSHSTDDLASNQTSSQLAQSSRSDPAIRATDANNAKPARRYRSTFRAPRLDPALKKRRFLCSLCMRNFASMCSLEQHMVLHTGEKRYKCSVCERCFSQPGTLKMHMRTHTGEKPYKCSVCPRRFTQSGSLDAHLRVHRRDGNSFTCDICGAVFARNKLLRRHQDATHNCEELNAFDSSSSLPLAASVDNSIQL